MRISITAAHPGCAHIELYFLIPWMIFSGSSITVEMFYSSGLSQNANEIAFAVSSHWPASDYGSCCSAERKSASQNNLA